MFFEGFGARPHLLMPGIINIFTEWPFNLREVRYSIIKTWKWSVARKTGR